MLPLLSGFRWLGAVLFPFLVTGALGVRSSYSGWFTPLNFFLMPMVNITNVMDYDSLAFFKSVEGLAAGAIYGTLWFQLVPPLEGARKARGIRRRLFRDAHRMAPVAPRSDEARLLFAERLADLLPLLPEAERSALIDDAMEAWRRVHPKAREP